MATVPAGPWVLVLGCHRSGTSAVTGALAAMGLHAVDPADRMERSDSNPEHWESLGAALLDDRLLASVGATWDAPPPLDADAVSVDGAPEDTDPGPVMAAAYPEPGPVVWKDPRACLLLPYWRSVLPGPLTAVLVWRDPLAVARSLQTRDGIPLAEGLALWEHYNRSVARGLQGVDTYVVDYASVVEDPGASLAALAGWMGGLPQLAGPYDVDAATATVDARLVHESSVDAADVPDDHRSVATWLAGQAGGHRPLDAEPPPATSPWPEAVLAARRGQAQRVPDLEAELAAARAAEAEAWRRIHRTDAEFAEYRVTLAHLLANRETKLAEARAELEAERATAAWARDELDQLRASTSWRVTAPLRSLLGRIGRS